MTESALMWHTESSFANSKVDLDVISRAPTWGDGLRSYSLSKVAPVVIEKPKRVTHKDKLAEASIYNPILQKYTDPELERAVQDELTRRIPMKINAAFDKQMEKGQHFDIISQVPKKGHRHEQVYVQRTKPPSLVTATLAPYNIVSCLGLDRHHWAPPEKRPESPHDAPKPRMANPNARPRSSDIITGKYKHRHEEKVAEAAAEQAKATVDTYWKKNVFNPVTCTFYDEVKEAEYIRAKEEDVRLRQGRSNLSKLPPTLANSVSLMYDIATGVVKDEQRLKEYEAALRTREESQAKGSLTSRARMEEEREQIRINKEVRSCGRVDDKRFKTVTDRGYDIVNGLSYDKHGTRPPPPRTRAKPGVWDYHERALAAASSSAAAELVQSQMSGNRSSVTSAFGEAPNTQQQQQQQQIDKTQSRSLSRSERPQLPQLQLPVQVTQVSQATPVASAAVSLSRASVRSTGF